MTKTFCRKKIKNKNLGPWKHCFPKHTSYHTDFHRVRFLSTKSLTHSFPLLFFVTPTWTLSLFSFFQLNLYLFLLAQYLWCKLLSPGYSSFSSASYWKAELMTSGFPCYKFVPLSLFLLNSSSAPKWIQFHVSIPLTQSITYSHFSPTLCRSASSLWRSHLHPVQDLFFLPHHCLCPKQFHSVLLQGCFCYSTALSFPLLLALNRSLASTYQTPLPKQLHVNE